MNRSLLKLQIGPVQDFIAQARSTRDLWSGSYLLSWLMAAGAAAVVKKVGGKASVVISPTLEGQPLFDLHQEIILRRAKNSSGKEPLFKTDPGSRRILDPHDNDDLLTPNFTNILVAEFEMSGTDAGVAAEAMVAAIRGEWQRIAEACWDKLRSADLVEEKGWRRDRFLRQLSHFPNITWQITTLPPDGKIETLLAGVPMEGGLRQKLLTARLADGSPDLFPALITRNSWQLDAVRQLREFRAWGPGGRTGNDLPNEKDSITGREEGVVGGKNWWQEHFESREETIGNRQRRAIRLKNGGGPKLESALWPILFRERQQEDWVGAIQLVKRLWHWAYLKEQIGLEATHRREPKGKQYPFPSTPQIAIHDPAKNVGEYSDELEEELAAAKLAEEHSPYFAVLAVDGDNMGRWLGGENTADGPKREFRIDLSKRLSNFALRCVRPIVEACDGRLIVAGGEDVTALLPADTALDCARFLRAAYRADFRFVEELQSLAKRLCQHHFNHGYVEPPSGDDRKQMSAHLVAAQNRTLFAVTGNAAHDLDLPGGITGPNKAIPDFSAGIAIAHYKEPLQDVVRAAHAALHDAKNVFGRAAVAVTLVKHSGETVEWGCKWESGGLELLDLIQRGRGAEILSGRFPHRLVEVLTLYLLARAPDEPARLEGAKEFEERADEIFQREFDRVLERQSSREKLAAFENTHEPKQKLAKFLVELAAYDVQAKLRAVIGLCQIAAFIEPAVYSLTFTEKKSAP